MVLVLTCAPNLESFDSLLVQSTIGDHVKIHQRINPWFLDNCKQKYILVVLCATLQLCAHITQWNVSTIPHLFHVEVKLAYLSL